MRSRTGVSQTFQFNIAGSATVTVGTDWTRVPSVTASLGTGNRELCFLYSAAAVDIDIWHPQMELGDVVTDYEANGEQLPTNTPLLPASTCNGLLIEESRANRILWCRDATQSNWTKTNVTAAKTATGIDGVANAASTLTATADNGTCVQTITLASGSRTASVYLKRITGTGNVQVSLDGSTWSTVDLSSTECRRIVLSGTVTNPVVGIRLATNGDAVAMDYAQVEDGAFATTPILTTTASATRSADVATCLPTVFPAGRSPVSNTLVAFGSLPRSKYASSSTMFSYGASPRAYLSFSTGATSTTLGVFDGVLGAATVSTSLPAGDFFALAGSFNRSELSISSGNFAPSTALHDEAIEAISPMRFYIGMRSDGVAWWKAAFRG
jgi:hypothetical protein